MDTESVTEPVFDAEEEEEASEDQSTEPSAFPIGQTRPFEYVIDGAWKRLKTTSYIPAMQALLDALPSNIFDGLGEDKVRLYATELSNSPNFAVVLRKLRTICRSAVHAEQAQKLIRMDKNRYDHNWHCRSCGHRWGRHDERTLACPKITVVETDEI